MLIVDDEPTAREGIRMYLEGEKGLEIVGECSNGIEAVSVIREQSPDLVFLDIQMPGMDGFEVIKAIGVEKMPATIFVTAYDKYALRAFDVHALDYLLKPFDQSRLLKAVSRSKAMMRKEDKNESNLQLLALIKELRREPVNITQSRIAERNYQERIVIKQSGHIFFLNVDEIDWIEAAGNYIKLHAGRETHLIRDTIRGLESKLNPNKFLRVRRTVIINAGRIKELHPLFNGKYRIIFHSGTEATSSRRFREKIRILLGE